MAARCPICARSTRSPPAGHGRRPWPRGGAVDIGELGCAPSVVRESRRPLVMSPFGVMVIARTWVRRCGRLPGCWAPRSPDGQGARMLGSGPGGWTTVPPSGFPDLADHRISPISPTPAAILEWRGAERTLTLQRLPAPPATTAADPPAASWTGFRWSRMPSGWVLPKSGEALPNKTPPHPASPRSPLRSSRCAESCDPRRWQFRIAERSSTCWDGCPCTALVPMSGPGLRRGCRAS